MAEGGTIKEVQETDMKLKSTPLCEPCLKENKESKAHAQWHCEQCTENMCDDCVLRHLKASSTVKSHTLSEIEQTRDTDRCVGARDSVQLGSRDCDLHPGLEVKNYCATHMSLCCSSCLVGDHTGCKTVLISEASKGYSKSEEFIKLESKLEILKYSVARNSGVNFKNAKAKVEKFSKEGTDVCRIAADRLFGIHVEANAAKAGTSVSENMGKSTGEMEELLRKLERFQVSLDSTADVNEILFIYASRLRCKLQKIEIYMNHEGTPTPWVVRISPDYENLIDTVVGLRPTSTQKLSIKHDGDSDCIIADMESLTDGRYLIIDSANKAIKVFLKNNDFQAKHILEDKPLNITEVEPGKIVVTLPEKRALRFISVTETLANDVNVQFEDTPTGLAMHGGKIYVSFRTYIRVLDRGGHVVERISKAEDGDHLFESIDCIQINGDTGRFYMIDAQRLVSNHVETIRQQKTRNQNVPFRYGHAFKPSITIGDENSLYACAPREIIHFTQDLIQLQTFDYAKFCFRARMSSFLPSTHSRVTVLRDLDKKKSTPRPVRLGTFISGIASPLKGSSSYSICFHKGTLLIGGESDCLSIVTIG